MACILKFLNEFSYGQNYVEVKKKRYRIHPTESFTIRLRETQKSLRTQNRVQNET